MKKSVIWIAIALVAIAGFAYLATSNRAPNVPKNAPTGAETPATYALNIRTDATIGNYLTAANGMTLYTFVQDEPGKSNCDSPCAVMWPPYAVSQSDVPAPNVTGTISTVFRADGFQQMAYNGWPLYFWKKDAKPGDTTGNGLGNIWFAAKP